MKKVWMAAAFALAVGAMTVPASLAQGGGQGGPGGGRPGGQRGGWGGRWAPSRACPRPSW